MTFPKISKEELTDRLQTKIKQSHNVQLSKALTSKVFDLVFELVVEVLEEGKEVVAPHLGVFKFKTLPETKRRDIGRNSFITVPGYYRPRLALNDALRQRLMGRGLSFVESETNKI